MAYRSQLMRWPRRLGRLSSFRADLEPACREDAAALYRALSKRYHSGHHADRHWHRHGSLFHPGRFSGLFRAVEEEFQRMRAVWEEQSSKQAAARAASRTGFAAADLHETEKNFVVRLDLPGIKKPDIKVQVSRERLLTVSGKRESTSATQLPTGFQRSERDVGSFQRQFQLPETADISNITAKAEDGVLSIEVAKLDAAGSGVSEVAIA